jgi:gluconolactonase
MKLEGREIAAGLDFPEGPIAMSDGSVLVVEIAGATLLRIDPGGHKHVVAKLGGGPNGAAIGPDGKCYVCNNGGFSWTRAADGYLRPTGRAADYSGGRIERVDLETGAFEVLYTSCDGEPLKGPNDIVFDGTGGFWFSDLGKTYGRLMDRGAIYYARTDGSLIREAVFPIMTPNGVGLSPDGKTLYAAETETSRLWPSRSSAKERSRKNPGPLPTAAGSSPVCPDISGSILWRSRPAGTFASPPLSGAGSPSFLRSARWSSFTRRRKAIARISASVAPT